MVASSLNVNLKGRTRAIGTWGTILYYNDRETSALYSLLQHSTQVQIRFFIPVLQQMARADPMSVLLNPATGGSTQRAILNLNLPVSNRPDSSLPFPVPLLPAP
ncbi:hypothetical protein EDB85DRAFT_1861725 [Lactarius pseudohatsudake]|nr:hypothetical protein EDB85DRAFT_1861725 [Lactarius pseudohatsudake]